MCDLFDFNGDGEVDFTEKLIAYAAIFGNDENNESKPDDYSDDFEEFDEDFDEDNFNEDGLEVLDNSDFFLNQGEYKEFDDDFDDDYDDDFEDEPEKDPFEEAFNEIGHY
ncbi:MAG: hypothetical protein K5917_06865 [Clostridiales bacterium]|nr:hypothetical protein [Clostridiales bacterium]